MSTYEILLTLHLFAIVVWLGGGLTLNILVTRMGRVSDPAETATVYRQAGWIGQRFFLAASAVTLVTGLLLVNELDLSLGEPWISFGFAVLLASALVGALYLGPQSERIGEVIREEGAASQGVTAARNRLLAINRVELTLLFLVVAAMATKPGM